MAQVPVTPQDICSAFQKNPDGSWTSVKSVTITSPQGGGQIQIRSGMTFRGGVLFMGLDLAKYLDQIC